MSKFSLLCLDTNQEKIISYTKGCMEEAGMSENEIANYVEDAKSSNWARMFILSYAIVERCNDLVAMKELENIKYV